MASISTVAICKARLEGNACLLCKGKTLDKALHVVEWREGWDNSDEETLARWAALCKQVEWSLGGIQSITLHIRGLAIRAHGWGAVSVALDQGVADGVPAHL